MVIVKIYLGVVTKFHAVMNFKECPALLKVEIYNLNQRYVCPMKCMLKFALIVINFQPLFCRSLTKYKNKYCLHSLLKKEQSEDKVRLCYIGKI